jgi:DNA-binding NarL/FixJ family response regulator
MVPDAGKRCILVVDDHPLVRAGVCALIHGEPDLAVCGEAGTASEALALFRRTTPDVVIVDLALPDGSGLDLVKRLAGAENPPRILVCSMHEESLFAERALKAGAHGYINKQEATSHVISAIRRILSGQIYLSAHMTEVTLQRLAGGKAGSEVTASVQNLSNRELEVFRLTGQCLSSSQIAEHLHLSVKTVETHRANIKRKLNLKSGNELTRYAVQWILEQH